MKKRLILFFIFSFALLFLSSPNNWGRLGSNSYANGTCSFELSGDDEIDGVPFSYNDRIGVHVRGGVPGEHKIRFQKEGTTINDRANMEKTILVSAGGTVDTNVYTWQGGGQYGVYHISYDKYGLFNACPEGVSPDDKTFYIFSRECTTDSCANGLEWMISPNHPPTNYDEMISIYIHGVDNLVDKDGNSYHAFMVKSYNQDNGKEPPGFTGSFASQASGGSLYVLDEGDGAICDENPHEKGGGFNCVNADHWGPNDFIRSVMNVIALRGICEDMRGVSSSCNHNFKAEEYMFAIYGIEVPPKKGVETSDDPTKDPCEGSEDKSKGVPGQDIPVEIDVDTCDVHGPLGVTASGSFEPAVFKFTVEDAGAATGDFPGIPTVHTPFGDVPISPAGIATAFLNLGLGSGGGLAFLLMVFGAYRLIASAGDPEAVQKGRQTIAAAVVGLLVIVFAIFLLRLLGIGVLGLPIGN